MKPKHLRAPVLIALAVLDGRVRVRDDGWEFRTSDHKDAQWHFTKSRREIVGWLREVELRKQRMQLRVAQTRAKLLGA